MTAQSAPLNHNSGLAIFQQTSVTRWKGNVLVVILLIIIINGKEGPRAEPQTRSTPTISEMIWKLIKDAAHFVLRLYLTFFLIIYHWIYKIITRALQPLEPVIEQVRKVPKKDISVEGIFYQTLRLQFLVLLYFSPYVIAAFNYVTQPLVWVKNWVVEYVEEEDDSWKRSDPSVLKEG